MSPRGPGLRVSLTGVRCRGERFDAPHSGIGPTLRQPAPGPGPASVHSAEEARVTAALLQTVRRDSLRRDGSPNGVAWRYPDWTAVGFRFRNVAPPKGLDAFPRRASAPRPRTGALTLRSRTRFLGSVRRSPAVTSRLRRPGSVAPGVGRISLRGPRRHVRRQ